MRVFQRWVSLGNYCLPKFQINRHIARTWFGLAENSTARAHGFLKELPESETRAVNGGTLLLDWCVVEDYSRLIALMDGGLNYAMTADAAEEVRDADGAISSIRCRRAGLIWPHLFDETEGLRDWRSQLPAVNATIAHLADGFRGLRRTTLYVMAGSAELAASDLPDRLCAALARLRGAGAAEFRLLICLPAPHGFADRGRLLFRSYDPRPDVAEYPYLGNAASWDTVFAEFALDGRI